MTYDAVIIVGLLLLAGALALPLTGDTQQAFRDPLYTAYLAGVWFLYLGGCWTHGGQTMGMRAWKCHIVTQDGAAVGWAASAGRYLVSLASALVLGVGFLASLWRADRACWHDRASATRLLRLD